MLSQTDRDALSYFEYTTLLAMFCFNDCDYVVLEAGLGGEHDATNVFPKILSVFTPIAYDHEDFLGKNIVSIAQTKCNSMTQRAVIADQKYLEVLRECSRIAQSKGCMLYGIDDVLDENEKSLVASHARHHALANYLHDNLLLGVSALKLLGFAISAEMIHSERPLGRLYAYGPNIMIDVGHNPLAAEAIKTALAETQVVLIYNSYADKDYESILKILKPVILHVEILKVEDARIETLPLLQSKLDELKIPHKVFESIDEGQNYLVFGSFKVVETFLRGAYA
jgi:dihydrofolate synthase/folylpolyglutamate synthase